ncbi:MAG: Zn-dependent alcohol dehydrogenase [Hyphomicrobiaceae bacterium]
MKAAMFHAPHQPLSIENVELDEPGPREVLVKTAACGVCHSDLHYIDGHYKCEAPAVLGHEAAGVVEKVGSAITYLEPGDHVISCLSVFCGDCEYCTTGRPFNCMSPDVARREGESPRISQNGKPIHQFFDLSAFAEKMLVHEHALVKIRKDMPLDRAALIGCGVTTGVGAVVNTARIEVGSAVAVIGCGGVGLAAVNGAAIAGAGRIIAIDMNDAKLELAKRFGATHTINASEEENVVKAVKRMTNRGVDYAFEAIGLRETAEQAFKMLRPSGTATVIGMVPAGQMMEIHAAELLLEKKLQGSNMGSNRFRVDMPRYVDFYLDKKLHLDDMIARRIDLEQVNEAFEEMRRGNVARSVIMFD